MIMTVTGIRKLWNHQVTTLFETSFVDIELVCVRVVMNKIITLRDLAPFC